ncbi:AAA family ATPase [Acetobacter sacchari]|uniref:AAA family ATPase n=1 Tax=Acetobacter sacchari TaxID=2661687 RepID=A0ABS3M1D4_9PROT|nr:AAA family ATPase [Acetobacter sacchari]MBO1361989.1 AAA family ATPase [Acetobacter sacchari]
MNGPVNIDGAVSDGLRQAKRSTTMQPNPLRFVDVASLAGKVVADREWVVDQWLPAGCVTVHYAAGGEGKTLLAQQLMTSVAAGVPWIGLHVKKGRVLGMFCEDDEDELHRRQNAINVAYGVTFDDLSDMRWTAPVGDDNTLVRFENDGTPVETDRLGDLRAFALHWRPSVIVLDVSSDLFGGNENVRTQVSVYLKAVLGALARDTGAAVLLNAHPSRAGISSGDLDGGSTAWNGGVRSRWGLYTPNGEDGEPRDETVRVLSKKKANYATRGDEIRLNYRDGVLWPEKSDDPPLFQRLDKERCEQIFLDLLDEVGRQGRHASDSRNSANYAPKLFSQNPKRQRFTRRDFETAMNRLFGAGQIKVEPYGKPSANTKHLVRAESCEGGEGLS